MPRDHVRDLVKHDLSYYENTSVKLAKCSREDAISIAQELKVSLDFLEFTERWVFSRKREGSIVNLQGEIV